MRKYTVGCVPFVNARPLVAWFEHLGEQCPIKVTYELPSRLPTLLDKGECDAVLASSYDALANPGRTVAANVCIGSFGPAESVKLLSKIPFDEVRTLALDSSSLTSNALAQIILAERYGAHPSIDNCTPNLDEMLANHDAAVLIGDIGMSTEGTGLHTIDLGDAWTQMTGLPFVWALWIGTSRLDERLVSHLYHAERWSNDHIQEVIDDAVESTGWDRNTCARYLTRTMLYRLGERELEGLRLFASKIKAHRLSDCVFFPRLRQMEQGREAPPQREEAHQLH